MKYRRYYLTFIFILFFSSSSKIYANNNVNPPLQHGKTFTDHTINIEEYYVSEKLDGVRGYWNGKQLLTRQGKVIQIPHHLTKTWPNIELDGELWIARNQFDEVSGCVRSTQIKPCWQKIGFYLFDLPSHKGVFSERVKDMQSLCHKYRHSKIYCIEQTKGFNFGTLYQKLDEVTSHAGEGLMLHHQNAYYQVKRVNHLLKLKPTYQDIALVIGHIEGKGKYQGQLGAIRVKNSEGIIFKIGTGFSDSERQSPPIIGSKVAYKYLGKTKQDVPRFASFLHVMKKE